MTDRELMQMALDALEAALSNDQPYISRSKETADALRARLAQPEPDDGYCQACDGNHCTAKNECVALDNPKAHPEPLPAKSKGALSHEENKQHNKKILDKFYEENAHLYTAPPQREWQGLTDDDIEDVCWTEVDQRLRSFARAIEAKLKEKNT